jgi:hypothetical protein
MACCCASRRFVGIAAIGLGALFWPTLQNVAFSMNLTFCCQADNDLYRVLKADGDEHQRFNNPADAVNSAPEGSGVLVLADGYPQKTTAIEPAVFDMAAKKKLRMYVEYPAALPDMTVGPAQQTKLERVVACSDVFGDELKKMQIVVVHDCHFVPVTTNRSHLVIAKVAGFDRAVYGLDDVKTSPILFEHPGGSILVATTKLSQFVTARYAAKSAMQAIWRTVFRWLQPGSKPVQLDWTPTVRPTFDRNTPLSADAARRAIQRGIDWHTAAGVFVGNEAQSGVNEGMISRIHFDGTQPIRFGMRTDCNGESSLAFALRWKLDGDPHSRNVASNLLDWIYFRSGLFENDPAKANYGLLYWTPAERQMLYQDNDVKAILGCLGTAGVLGTDRWDDVLLKNILGNFRTTGVHGFRGHFLNERDLSASGWQAYWRNKNVSYQPHYEAWIWATYLWLYDKTRYEPLLERTRRAIQMTMEAYPDRWQWTNGIQQERGRMLLPLAWLVRVDDRPQHRVWLKRIVRDIERCQDACGAIREELGAAGQGECPPPPSNAKYGTAEASLIQENGDPLADLLYTCNFTFLGLHEAYAATGDKQYRRMADRLADFLVRIQVKSEAHPQLDGGWFRAFDYRKWEYWGSNADAGWGAWSIEVGWTQAWIPTVLTLREIDTSLWDLSKRSRIKDRFEQIRKQMLPDDVIRPTEGKK